MDIEAILDIVRQRQVGRIVVGLPYSMDGSIGEQAEKVETFVQELCSHTDVPIELRDERLTTVSARCLMQPTKGKRTKKIVRYDAVAAALILQSYLDEKH